MIWTKIQQESNVSESQVLMDLLIKKEHEGNNVIEGEQGIETFMKERYLMGSYLLENALWTPNNCQGSIKFAHLKEQITDLAWINVRFSVLQETIPLKLIQLLTVLIF